MSLADKFSGDEPRSAKDLAAEYGMRHREFYRFLRALTGPRPARLGGSRQLPPDRSRRRAQDRLAGRGPLGVDRADRRHGEAGVEGVRPRPVHRRHRVREGPRHGPVRIPRSTTRAWRSSSARRWSASTAASRRRWPRPTTFPASAALVDVGGATGNMLGHVLSRHPNVAGVLYDLPHVVADAPALLAAHGVADRVDDRARQLLRERARRRTTPICSPTSSTTGTTAQCLTILGNCARR